jgi:hypothetical protein
MPEPIKLADNRRRQTASSIFGGDAGFQPPRGRDAPGERRPLSHERRQRPGSSAEYDSGGGGGIPRGPRVRVMQLFRSQEAEVG